jgi:hypothetical protein
MNLANEQWNVLKSRIGELLCRAGGRGWPWRDNGEVLNGILWI